eukprot:COSAG01_NODE_3732_length_5753_cov_3.662894_3_plen_159_part_00
MTPPASARATSSSVSAVVRYTLAFASSLDGSSQSLNPHCFCSADSVTLIGCFVGDVTETQRGNRVAFQLFLGAGLGTAEWAANSTEIVTCAGPPVSPPIGTLALVPTSGSWQSIEATTPSSPSSTACFVATVAVLMLTPSRRTRQVIRDPAGSAPSPK